jgi:hypothetical protein
LLLPLSAQTGILYDCKAARDGYRMIADHERRLIEYGQRRYELAGTPVPVTTIVVVSSFVRSFLPRMDGSTRSMDVDKLSRVGVVSTSRICVRRTWWLSPCGLTILIRQQQ